MFAHFATKFRFPHRRPAAGFEGTGGAALCTGKHSGLLRRMVHSPGQASLHCVGDTARHAAGMLINIVFRSSGDGRCWAMSDGASHTAP